MLAASLVSPRHVALTARLSRVTSAWLVNAAECSLRGVAPRASRDAQKCSDQSIRSSRPADNTTTASLCTINYETSVTGISPEKVLIAVLRHPFGARQVALPGAARPLRMLAGVDVRDDPRHLGAVGAFCVGSEETERRDEMLAVVSSEIVSLWSLFGYGRIER